jgi:hypothetical protein
MNMSMRSLLSVLLVAGTVVIISWQYVAPSSPYAEAGTIAEGAENFKELETRFQSLAEEKGALYAFEVLRRATLPPNTDMHLLGHSVGDMLFKEKGVDGIADCTEDFRNACSHSVVIGALNEFGEAALPMIREACRKAPGGSGAYTMCYHGLGHGVFAYFEYDLAQTVDFCRKTGTSEYRDREFIECVGGAVMELMGGGGHDRALWLVAREKYLNPDHPLAPCTDAVIPDEVKAQCLTYLTPRLWQLAGIDLGSPDPKLFAPAFRYCDAIPMSEEGQRSACYGGFGKELLPLVVARDVRSDVQYSDAQLSTVIAWCTSAERGDGQDACVAEALSSAFWGGEHDPATSFRLCGLSEDSSMKNACYLRLAGAIHSYVKDPSKHADLCRQLPQEYAGRCEHGGNE